MVSTARILVASSLAPLAAAIPLFLLSVFVWSHFVNGPFNKSELSSVTPLMFAVEFVVPVYALLSLGLLVASLLLRIFKALTCRAMLLVVAVISIAVGFWLGCDWQSPFKLSEAVLGVITQFLVAFAVLAAVSAVWCRIALGCSPKPSQRGAGEA